MVLFSDLEGRLHMLDYDKKFLLRSPRQPHLRWLFDTRLHAPAGERLALIDRLERILLGAGRYFRTGKVLVFGDV